MGRSEQRIGSDGALVEPPIRQRCSMNEQQTIPSLHDRLIRFVAAGRTQAESYPADPLKETLLARVWAVEIKIAVEDPPT